MAAWKETDTLKPIEKAIARMVSESPGRNVSERSGGPERLKLRRSSLTVERRRQHGTGVRPAGARARRPVAWIAGWRETDTLKPIDEAIGRMVSESPGRNASEREVAPKDPNGKRDEAHDDRHRDHHERTPGPDPVRRLAR